MATTSSTGNTNPFRTEHEGNGTENIPTGTSSTANLPERLQDDSGLYDELPPPYTPGPDVHSGESTVQYGPSRPFQSTPARPATSTTSTIHRPPPPQSHSTGSTPSVWRQLADNLVTQLTAPPQPQSSSGYPGRQAAAQRQSQSYTTQSNLAPPPPPPRPASIAGSRAEEPQSEFARDFYATPPPPPPRPSSFPLGAPSASASASTSGVEDDGRPTTTPTPGRPLLRDGKLLVYPRGFECGKCHNTGYKGLDPTNPCKKCWRNHAKPFVGPLAYAFAPTSASDSAPSRTTELESGTTFQRPLPWHRPPSRHAVPPRPPLPPPRPPPPPRPLIVPHPASSSYQPAYFRPQFGVPGQRGPPGPVYPAGDPRIGGRLCWNCSGRGRESLLGFELGDCVICGGIGRVF